MPTVSLIGELFPADPPGIGALLAPMGLAVAPQTPCREWRDLYAALDCRVAAAVHPFYTASIREFRAAGRPVVGSGPVGVEGTAAWLDAVGEAANVPSADIDAAKARALPAIKAALAANPINARITLSGYEGSELLVGAVVDRGGCGRALCRNRLPAHGMGGGGPRVVGRTWNACAVPRQPGAGLGGDDGCPPGFGCRHHAAGAEGEGAGHPGAVLHQHGLREARCSGRRALGRWRGSWRHRRAARHALPEWWSSSTGVGAKDTAGYGWTEKPQEPKGARERYKRQREAKARATEAVGS